MVRRFTWLLPPFFAAPLLRMFHRRFEAEGRLHEVNDLGTVWKRVYPAGGSAVRTARQGDERFRVNVCEFEGRQLYLGLPYEREALALTHALAREGDVCLDVGANVGVYSVALGRRVGGAGRVHAFEPADGTFRLLERNIRMNGVTNVTLNRLALGRTPGRAPLYVNEESGLSGLSSTGRGRITTVEWVEVDTVDGYVDRHDVGEVRLLKIDVEGHEADVLWGADTLLRSQERLVVLCEAAEENLAPLGRSAGEVVGFAADRGYEAWHFVDGGPHRLARMAEERWPPGGLIVLGRPGWEA